MGNVRVSYTKDPLTTFAKIVEENHYYPFGLKHANYNSDQLAFQPNAQDAIVLDAFVDPIPLDNYLNYEYKYNGKELQREFGLNMYDYGARNYDPAIGRWMNMDPLAENHHENNPYMYANNNPIIFVDPDGKDFTLTGVAAQDFARGLQRELRNADDNGYNKEGQKINDNGGDKTDYLYDDDNNIVGSRNVAVGELNPHKNFSATGRSYGYKPQSGAIEENNILFELLVGEAVFKAAIRASVGAWGAVFGRGVPAVAETVTETVIAKVGNNFVDDAVKLTTSSKSIAPSRTYTIYDGSGQLYKFGVTDSKLMRYGQSLKQAGPGAYGKFSGIIPKQEAHIMEKYLRSLQYNSTKQYALPGMKIPYPVNFNTGLPIRP